MRETQVGEMYLVKCGTDGDSSIVKGVRPVVVVIAEANSPIAYVVPFTGSKKRANKNHVRVEGYGLDKPSVTLIEQTFPIDKLKLGKLLGSLSGTEELECILKNVSCYFARKIA